MALSAGIVAICESGFLGRPTPDSIQFRLEIQNVAIAAMLIAMVWFVHFRLQAGWKWLAWGISAAWGICVVANFASSGNLTFVSVDKVEYLSTPWGEEFGVALGKFHPLKILADLATLAIILFVAQATFVAYRSGRKRRAIRTGGSILFFIIVAGVHTPLVDAGVVQTPFIISLVFVSICMALALDLAEDVVNSVQLNENLLIERQRWYALTENVDLAVVRVDHSGRIAYANPSFQRISGRSGATLIGSPVSDLVPEQDKIEMAALISETVSWTSRSQKRRQLKSKSGDTRELIWHSVALVSQEGEADGFISFGQDITAQLRKDDELRSTRQEIERLTRAVALGELSSSLAHELSQPIAAILSNTQTLQILRQRSGKKTNETDEILEDILADSQRARELMHRVRGFMYNTPPSGEPFELTNAVDEVIAIVLPEAQKNRVRIESHQENKPKQVTAARLEIQQVLMNLLVNAIQAIGGRGGDGRVLVSWSRSNESGFEIAVEDNGPGLQPERKKSVFDPFVTTKAEGMGIGLAVSKRIVERYGGKISTSASELGGAKFVVFLPEITATPNKPND